MNDAKFDYGMTAMSALMKGAQAEKKLPSSEKKLTASPVPEGKQYLKDQKEQIEKDILHIKDDNFTEENEELIYSEGAAAEESEAQARESAEEIAEAQEEEKRNKRNRRKSVIKLVVIAISITIVIIIGSIAWFTMNREVETSGMSIAAQSNPYTILTRSDNGYYSSIYTSLDTGGMEWKISSDYNLDNHSNAIEEGETEPGLEPGDHGILEFRVNPNSSDSITVDCIFDVKAYAQSTTTGEITEINNSTLVSFIKAHIMLFSGYNSETGKYTGLIGNDSSLRRVLADQTYTKNDNTYTKIYWIWPEHLSELTSENNSRIIYAPSERSAVISHIAENKDGFFKDCNDSVSDVSTALTALSLAYNTATYNHYNMKYDNADLDIGNNVSFVMLSMQVE